MTTLQGIIDEIIADLRAVDGLNWVPDEPTEQVTLWPAAVVYSGEGRAKIGPSDLMTTHDSVTIAVVQPIEGGGMAHAISAMLPFREKIPNAIFNGLKTDQLNGTVQNIGEITHTFGPIDWGGVEMIGWLFTVTEIKQQNAIT